MAENMSTTYELQPKAHPGETVADYLEFKNWAQRDLARRTGITPKTISEICNGKAPITPSTALALEKVFQRPAHFWLNLQRRYDETEARRRAALKLPEWNKWAKHFPINEMKRYGWIDTERRDQSGVDALLTFFGVSSPESWRSVWEASGVAYRQTRKFATSIQAISAWTRQTELRASEIETDEFDEARLRSLVQELRQQTKEAADTFVPKVQELCATAGVAVVWAPELTHTGISGCARWLTERKALIGLTLRYKTDDQMWFTFFHEVAHILLHRRQHAFILDNAAQDLGDKVVDPEMQKGEEEANRFASDTLILPEALNRFIKVGSFSNEAIHGFAKELDIGPGIVIGRLQREGLLAYHQGNALKRVFTWTIDKT